MDILDIDEELKDDSFICLEDKTHDDVSNILQQWKSNNCLLPPQYQHEQAYKLNSRTFTRPRKKSAQNLEQHFAHAPGVNNAVQTTLPFQLEQLQPKFTIASPQSAFNMEIGGLVTTMHKSFLQDTSPPSSICSSMEVSVERMNNSLITSADFTNINFLQSTQSLDFNELTLNGGEVFNLANKATSDGYTLSDMIRDRKALESLTMSGDGTLIKDSHIGQIDDISLALSKTASGYSTMDNSTESMQEDQLFQQRNGVQTSVTNTTVCVPQNKGGGLMDRTMLLSDDVISDTTFDLVENSLCESSINGNDNAIPATTAKLCNETFKRPWPMDETVCIPNKANATFEFKQLTPDARTASEVRCETPENVAEALASRKFYESTPHASSLNKSALQNTPTTSKLTVDEVNISPIVGDTRNERAFNDTFGPESDVKAVNSKTYSGTLPRLESIEQMLDDIEHPNETFEKIGGRTHVLEQSAADIQMQNVLELAHAEEELLASNNDQEFEDMLEEFSKVEVNAEHMKFKKSLETIKRRFNRDTVTLSKAPHLHQEFASDQDIADLKDKQPIDTNPNDANDQRRNGSYGKTELSAYKLNESSALSRVSSPSPSSASISASSTANSMLASAGNASTSSERLLSRRSRLYDNINLSTISAANTQSPTRSLGASFTVHKREDNEQECSANTVADKHETEYNNDGKQANNFEKTEEANENMNPPTTIKTDYSGIGTYKLSERRDRDRDRFKTIKIVKGRSANDGLAAVNVPCIDDDISTAAAAGAVEVTESTEVFNNNHSEKENVSDAKTSTTTGSQSDATKPSTASKINPNFLTYKKPRDKPKFVGDLAEITQAPTLNSASNEELEKPSEPPSRIRSRSRPRYISGLQKMTVVKATSAGDLDRATAHGGIRPPNASISHVALNNCQDVKATIVAAPNKYNRTQPLKTSKEEVKSPMGTKSKSFHNLSSNFGFNGSANNLTGVRANSIGLKKPSGYESGGMATNDAKDRIGNGISNAAHQQSDEAVFKVPKLVSGLRAPGVKRAGLVRPSSGYYSLNSLAVKGMPPLPQPPLVNDADSDGGRHSPTDSMSSASSRGSVHNSSGSSGNIGKCVGSAKSATNSNTFNLTKITTGSTGIPKPSGLRPPTTNLKRSGLPKPAMATARR